MNEQDKEKKVDSGGKEREIILLGLLNIETVYGKDWTNDKDIIKKDIENKAVKLNKAFKDPRYFHEHFEFLSAEDYQYVKNSYIYSAILIFNPNLNKQKGLKENEKTNKHIGIKEGKKEEGIGVLVLTCKKMQKTKMKYMLIKMLKREIKVESVVLKKKEGIQNSRMKIGERGHENDKKNIQDINCRNEKENNEQQDNRLNEKIAKMEKHSELKYINGNSSMHPTINRRPFDTKVNNFFNMTAYLYGASNVLTNTSLVQREYQDDEWAEKLRRKKREKGELPTTFTLKNENNANNKEAVSNKSGRGLIETFTSLFKTR